MRPTSRIRREFEAAALPYLPDLYAIAVRMTRDPSDAQDLVQETILRAYTAWGSFVPGSNCRAWLIRILTNSFINHYRRGRSHRSFVARGEDEQRTALYGGEQRKETRDPEQLLAGRSFGDEVTAALDDLADDYRVVVLLADVEGLKYKEIAEALGCPIGTVMSRLFRARQKLQTRLQPYASGDYGIGRAA